MGMLLKLSRMIDRLTRLVGQTLIWLILAATLISAANAIARKLFNVGSNAFLEIQWYLFAAVFMLGAGYAFLQNAHVRIDVLANKLSKRTRTLIDIGGILFFLLPMCYLLSVFAWPVLTSAYETGEMSSNAGGLIRWPLFALVPAGFALLALQGISELFKRIAYLAGAGPDPLAHEPDAHAAPPAVTQDTTENAPGEARK
ncbi:TRAP transporter small permease subunit [Thauera sp. CAU 1555]|jgi:TRAP-type mannitol/chloroaromatic compound transport system permease small subunit|uniref:TRAP transporter small permease protein n=1 Tax=Thauera sedimentorum TaxID=2767595 RepID=A0ABR9BEZ3_9RHOO|nr:TRAP transporter small permease subunit [Thauera sedimentorum]MBC9073827.1 TRAP transporter small permease subunit [Thauera sedimentorum]MBD8504746.1 TRAP transporter small permease subunit [Thauera sedimentorum]